METKILTHTDTGIQVLEGKARYSDEVIKEALLDLHY